MAEKRVRHSCGCGFSTMDSEAAARHCDEKKHIITVTGVIQPSAQKPVRQSQPEVDSTNANDEFNDLRIKLLRYRGQYDKT